MGPLIKIAWLFATMSLCAPQEPANPSATSAFPSIEVGPSSQVLTSTAAPTDVLSDAPSPTTAPPPSATTSAPGEGSPAPRTPSSNITSITFSGNGCPQGTRVQFTGDLDSGLQITVPNFTAVSRGSDFDPRKRTINCQAHLSIAGGENGWQVTPDLLKFRGFSVLDNAETSVAFYFTTYWSQDASYTATSRTSISNPDGERLAKFVDTSVRHEVWSPCISGSGGGIGNLNLNFRAQAISANESALAYFGPLEVLGRPEAQVSQTITYKWRQC